MPKPDPALLDPARYPFCCAIETRFGDLDLNQHLNNVALTGLLEEGRVRFHRTTGHRPRDDGAASMVASLAIEFIGQSHFPDPLDMHVAALQVGRTSYRLAQLVTQSARTVAYAESVMVCIRDNRPAELSQAFREATAPWMLRP